MKNFITIFLTSFFFLATAVTEVRAEDLDATLLTKEISKKGAKAVIARLIADNDMTQFEKVCDKIESGNKAWLDVAKLLLSGSDAATTEGLVYSISRALPKSPRHVLKLIAESKRNQSWSLTVKNTCISTYSEPNTGVSEKFLADSEEALKSLKIIDNKKLDALRLNCLKSIQKDISSFKNKGV